MHICQHCQIEFKNAGGLGAHSKHCKSNPNRVQKKKSENAHARKGCTPWNKNMTGVQTAWNKGIAGSTTGHGATAVIEDARREKIRSHAIASGLGGYVQGSGRGKKGWFKGFFCDSSWELAYVIYCLDHNIQIRRNLEKRQYVWRDKVRNYIPDFVVEGVLTEIKGYKTDQWLAKLAANQDVVVLYEKDMKMYLQYVVDTYGKNYISLYE